MSRNRSQAIIHPVGVTGKKQSRVKPFVLEASGILLFVLFMTPFLIVLLNSAKTAKEIIYNPVALPSSWGQIFQNIKTIFENPTTDYIGAFFDSLIITTLSLAVISIFSAMCAWALVRNKKKWSTVIFMMFVAAMVIPFQVVMFPPVKWFKIVGDTIHIPLLEAIRASYLRIWALGVRCPFSSCTDSLKTFHWSWRRLPPSTAAARRALSSAWCFRCCSPRSLQF